MKLMNNTAEIARELLKIDNILILTHVGPDADCLGSSYALKCALEACGKKVSIANNDIIDKRFLFITNGMEKLDLPESFDYIISVDCADEVMFGKTLCRELAKRLNIASDGEEIPAIKPYIVIDHHVTNKAFGKFNLINPEAAACAEIIYDVICGLRTAITKETANFLYAAILGDTGGFRYSNTTHRTMEIASELIKTGYIDIADMNRRIFENKTLNRMMFDAKVIENTEIYKLSSGRDLALVCISDEMINSCGIDQTDSSGSIDIPRQIENVSVAVSLRESGDIIKISMRSNDETDVSEICMQFAGGGHKKAAGCKLSVGLAEAKKQILSKFDIIGE